MTHLHVLHRPARAGVLAALLTLAACGDEATGDGDEGGADGSGANGSGANGSGANGSGANGSGANGSGANGSGANGSGGAPGSELTQYTPDQADWSTFASKPIEGGSLAHDPDSVHWITPADWEAAKWDGTVYDPSQMTKQEFAEAICPHVDTVRGIREVFYEHQPFADDQNPTKAELDEWHRIAINHLRALVGYTSEDRQVKKDHCMFARALWGDERQRSTMWDAEYPGEEGSAFGPCQEGTNPHCGATFLPDAEDQAPYLPEGHAPCTTEAGSEGIFSGPKSNIPWSIKWSRGLCNTLIAEGFWGGHVGPWFHREKFGFSFWDGDPDNNNSVAILRAKWAGESMPNLYADPADEAP